MYEFLHHALETLTNYTIIAFEFAGIIILILSGLDGVRNYVMRNPKIRLILAEGMALSLEFKLGSEIARTVVIREMSELYFVAGIIILRASMTFLIHWEIDYEERSEAEKRKKMAAQSEACLEEDVSREPKKGLTDKILNARFGNSEQTLRDKAKAKYSTNQ